MRRIFALGVVTFVLALTACQDNAQPMAPDDAGETTAAEPTFSLQSSGDRVMPGRVLARFTSDADPAGVGHAYGLTLERMGRGDRFAILKGAVGNERALAARLGSDDQVVWAEPDYLRQTHVIRPELWAFYNPGDLSVSFTRGRNKNSPVSSYLSTDDADEDNIEGYGSGGGPVAIASIDTGVDFGHTEFGAATLETGWDYYENDADPSDTEGHGTHTTGTMAGETVGVAGVAGAAGNVTVYVYRVCGAIGCPTSAIVNAIYAATDAGVVAMNLSLGGGSLSQAEADAIQYATDNDALVIASAGNDGTGTVSCPACDDNAISVAASNWQDELSYYSNWGPGLDITAPGGELYSNTTEESGIYSSVPGGYAYYQGTSMAAPQVTGTAAVVASVTGATGSALRSALLSTTDDLGSSGYDETYGNGRLNSHRAVKGTTLDETGGGGGGGGGGDPQPGGLVASFSYHCNATNCDFDGSGSTGSIDTYAWAFGDGATDSGVTTTHAYTGEATFTVTLTVSNASESDQATQDILCKVRGKNLRCS